MKIVIDKVEQQENMILVTGKTSVGDIKGIWESAKPPLVSNVYHVELIIDYPCELDILQETQAIPYVCVDKDNIVFQGVCEDIDEDVYYIRFDMDWLEMLEISAAASKKKIGDIISFSSDIYGVKIYPYAL